MHEVYGIDIDDDDVMAARTWRWLRARILGLLTTTSRLDRAMQPAPAPSRAIGPNTRRGGART